MGRVQLQSTLNKVEAAQAYDKCLYFVLYQVYWDINDMATSAEDYLIDDDIPVRQFSGTLTFSAETAASQAAVDGMEASSIICSGDVFVCVQLPESK